MATPVDESKALAPTLMTLSFGWVDTTIASAFGLAQEARSESRAVVSAGIDGVEEAVKSGFRLGRKLQAGIDELASDALSRIEVGLRTAVRAVWRTGDDMAALAGRTAQSVAGDSAQRAAA